LNEISSKNFKSLNGLKFNSCISISYTIKKIHPRISLTTLSLKYLCNFFKFYDKYCFVTIYSIHSSFSLFVGYFKIIDYIRFKVNQYIFKNK
jgi:hypothetical protein